MREMSYQALGDLHIDLVGINETAAEQYRRELDLDSAIARSRFIAEGVTYTREAFASASDGVIVVSLGAEGGTIDAEFALSRSEEHTSELQSLMRISYAVFCLKKKKYTTHTKKA